MIDAQLMDYFKFDQADLIANQTGQFTEKQKTRLIKEDQGSRSCSGILGFILVGVALIGLALAIAVGVSVPDWGARLGVGAGFGCVWPAVWGGLGYWQVRTAFTKHEFKLARVQGRANIVRGTTYNSSTHTNSEYHELHIGGQRFDVPGSIADVIMQGGEYIVYYVEGTDTILSVEAASGSSLAAS